jgi:murein DD-endopeptidase MepM/ murein hydrolase activator NlpD
MSKNIWVLLLFLVLFNFPVIANDDLFADLVQETIYSATGSEPGIAPVTANEVSAPFLDIETNSPVLLPRITFENVVGHTKEYIAGISNKPTEEMTGSELIEILQERVRTTESKEPQSLFMLGRLLLTFAYHADFADQASAMIRMAQTHLLKAHGLYFQAKPDELTYCTEAETLLEDFFASDFIDVEKRTALELTNQGRTEEAARLLRIINYKTESDSPEVQAILAYTYNQMAAQTDNPEQSANYMNAANYYGQNGQIPAVLPEVRFQKLLESTPEPSDQQIDSMFSNLMVGIRAEVTPEKQIDSSIKNALELNRSGRYTEALETLRESVKKTNFKAAKPRYFLARQYQLMASLPQFSAQKAEFLQTMDDHIKGCIEIKNENLTTYTENTIWAAHAEEFSTTVEAETTTAHPSAAMVIPCSGRVSSPYGMRLHPVHRVQRMHNGIDIGAPRGTPLYAMHNGRVTRASTNGGYGKCIDIVYDDGSESRYAHLDNYNGQNGTTRVGNRVRRGEKVGEIDSTGLSTGHHLHLEIKRGGARIDPAIVLREILGRNVAVGTTF